MLSLAAPTTTDPTHHVRSDQAVAEPTPYETPYDPYLIEGFKSDHAALQASLDLLEHYILHNEFAKIPDMLSRFGDALQSHIVEEHEHLYRRVAISVRDDPATSALLKRTIAHTDGIARQVMIFIKHYKEIGVSRVNKDAFRHDLEVISDLLGERIKLEETSLYTLYQPLCRIGQLPDEDSLLSLESANG